jgi:hypothetical protein
MVFFDLSSYHVSEADTLRCTVRYSLVNIVLAQDQNG